MNKIGSLIPSMSLWTLGEDGHKKKKNNLELISHSNKEYKGLATHLLAMNVGCY